MLIELQDGGGAAVELAVARMGAQRGIEAVRLPVAGQEHAQRRPGAQAVGDQLRGDVTDTLLVGEDERRWGRVHAAN